jgi:hypothetical protein
MKKTFKVKNDAIDFANNKMTETLESGYQVAVDLIDYDKDKGDYIVTWKKEKVRRLIDD